jgi:predicted amidohydrolase YtcJ
MKILFNAHIHTLDPQNPTASAIAIERERIIALGEYAALKDELVGRAESHDLGGRTVIPGLTDAHIHLENYAMGLQKVDCETASIAECLERVAERARLTPPGDWILGHGWNQNAWEKGYGRAADLDAVAPQHPVYLTHKSLHSAWANRAALRQAGLSAASPDPADGRLGRDEHGELDGILYESATDLVEQALPQSTPEQVAQAIQAAQPALWRVGLTGVHDFDQRRCFIALLELHERGDLRLRVLKSIPLELLRQAAEQGLRSGFGDDYIRIGQVKIFADGALGPQTAAMFQPYAGSPDNLGMLFLDAEELFEHGRLAVENGLALAVHAIGDRANHEVLEAFAHLRAYEVERLSGQPRLRHRIEHVQVLHPDDAGRLAELGIIASMQPIHATSDMLMADRYWGERAALSYAWRTQLTSGARLAFGSDAPVESPNPFWGLHAAVTRRRIDGSPSLDGWYPGQRLTVLEALRAYTQGPAYAAGLEKRLGMLAPGYLADLLVLDTDPLACDPEQLWQIQPTDTMVGGEWVYET